MYVTLLIKLKRTFVAFNINLLCKMQRYNQINRSLWKKTDHYSIRYIYLRPRCKMYYSSISQENQIVVHTAINLQKRKYATCMSRSAYDYTHFIWLLNTASNACLASLMSTWIPVATIDNFSVVYWFILCIFGADESRKLCLDRPKLKLQMYIESTGWPQTPKEFEGTIMTFTYLSTESLFF